MNHELYAGVLNQMPFGVGIFQLSKNQEWVLIQTNLGFDHLFRDSQVKIDSMTLSELFITHLGLSHAIEPARGRLMILNPLNLYLELKTPF